MNSHSDVELYNHKEEKEQEEKEVREFLENSYEFKEMKKIGSSPQMQSAGNFVAAIEKKLTFSNILSLTRDIDPKQTDNVYVYNLGRNKTNAILYTMGFFSSNANFTYYALHLRENVEAHLEKRRISQENTRNEKPLVINNSL